MINYKSIVSSNLNRLRKQQNKSQAEVAKYLELTVAAYQNYEAGRREANYETLVKLADFYGVTTDYLLGREATLNPFSDLNTHDEDESTVLEKFTNLPKSLRVCILSLMKELVTTTKIESMQSNAQEESEIHISKTAARNGAPPREEILTQEEVNAIKARPDADPDL